MWIGQLPGELLNNYFVCFSDPNKGSPVSKTRLAHWITEVITSSYASAHEVLSNPVNCHSTRSVATSWAALWGVQLTDAHLPRFQVSIDLMLFLPQTVAQQQYRVKKRAYERTSSDIISKLRI